MSYRDREGEADLSTTGSLPEKLQWLSLSKAKVRSQELHPSLPHGRQGPKDVSHLPLPSQAH